MRKSEKGDHGSIRIIHTFTSMSDYVQASVDGHDDSENGASVSKSDSGWNGTETYEEAVHLATTGWDDIRPKVDVMLEPIREKLAEKLDMVPERHHDLIGYEPDIDRYLGGELECMWEDLLIEAPKMGKVHTLHISGCVPFTVSAETLAKRGAALVALVEAFTVCGAQLEIWHEMTVASDGWGSTAGTWSVLTRVHRAGDPLDINGIMFPLAHPSNLRRLCFGLMEGEMKHIRGQFGFYHSEGYGRPRDFVCADQIDASFQMSMGGERYNGFNPEIDTDPVAWVLKTLEAQGVYEPHDFLPS